MNLLETRGLETRIGRRTLCRDLDLVVRPGQCWCVLGRNGAGKTTLLLTLAGLRPAVGGTVLLRGAPLARLARREVARTLGMLFQEHEDPFPSTVLETALTGRHPHLSRWGWEGPDDHARARAALRAVDLEGMESRETGTLSGGERRRLGLATLLAQDPALFLLDEPTSHLDLHHQVRLLEHLGAKTRAEGKALFMVLHDLNLAARFADHFLLLFGDGESLHGPAAEVLSRLDLLERLCGHPLRPVPGGAHPAWLPG